MFGALGLTQPELRIKLEEEILYLHPSSSEGVPTEDPSVWGIVTLNLPKARTLRSLTVRLVGTQVIGWGGHHPYEESITLDKKVQLIPEGEDAQLEKGGHTFTFCIIVPSSTPSHERSEHGRVRHTIKAKAKGVGAMGGDIVTEETQLFFIQNPGGGGQSIPPPGLNQRMEGVDPFLGPYAISLQSQHIMVAGLLLLRLSLISTSTTITIYNIKVLFHQRFHLKSAVGAHEHHTPVDPRKVILLDSNRPANNGVLLAPEVPISRSSSRVRSDAPFRVVPEGTAFALKHLARIPNGESVRATTLPGGTNGINVSHSLVFEMTFSAGDEEERRTLSISKPVDIYSCCCLLDSLTLPEYSLADPYPEEPLNRAPPCVCDMPFEHILKHHSKFADDEHEFGEGGSVARQKAPAATPAPRRERGRPAERG